MCTCVYCNILVIIQLSESLEKWGKRIAFYLTESKYVSATSNHSEMLTASILLHVGTIFLVFADMQYDEDDDEITPDLWQEACWIVIR